MILGVSAVDADRAAVGRELLHVKEGQAVGGENPLGGVQREVREVLVIHLVELIPDHRLVQVRELDGNHPTRAEQDLEARDEIIEVGDLGQHVIAEDQVGPAALRHQLPGSLSTEELHERRDPLLLGDFRHVRRRLDAEAGDAALHEVLQQIAVVACHLDHAARRGEPEVSDHLLRVATAVVEPGIGEGGEVGVVGEDLLPTHILLELDQKAALADPRMERVERLHGVHLVRRNKALAQWRHPEIHHRVAQAGATEAAAARFRGASISGGPNGGGFRQSGSEHPGGCSLNT